MKKGILFIFLLCISTSCASRKPIPNTTANTEQYIRTYAPIAISNMEEFGIPASITLAQGILESGSGTSNLARRANNHFGIKCTPDWKGERMKKDDDAKRDCFRKYKRVSDSFSDHAKLLQRPRYQNLYKLEKTDYKGWAYGLKEAGYATNPNYPMLLINLIERYNLHDYDQGITVKDRDKKEKESNLKLTAENTPTKISNQNQKTHRVVSGDTLFSIAKKYEVTVEELMKWNRLENNLIRVGDELKVSNN